MRVGVQPGAQMATMLQYIVGVPFSMCVSQYPVVYLKSFIPESGICRLFLKKCFTDDESYVLF